MAEYHAEIEANRPVDPKTLVKQQFVMSKSNAAPAQMQGGNDMGVFTTSNNFYHQLTDQSKQVVDEQARMSNPVIESLDPAVFEVTAKKQSLMWGSQQYRDSEHRTTLNETTTRGTQNNIDPEIAERLRTSKHNIKVTNISEYSNALNRGRVFINPKFSSC